MRRRRRRRNPFDMTPFLFAASGLVALLYLAKKLGGSRALPGP